MSVRTLSQRRTAIDTQWDCFLTGSGRTEKDSVNKDIMASWQRSAQYIQPHTNLAPIADEYSLKHTWQGSDLCQATLAEQANMNQLVNEGEMVAAIADTSGRLLWTAASKHMRPRAESVNFTEGGIWDESSVGTNAVGLSLALSRPVTVFSSEHFLPSIREWVCYAAPIIHPQTLECVGVLDMSTTWQHYTPMGQAAVAGIAQSISAHLPCAAPRAEIEIHALGQPRVIYQGEPIPMPLRQLEILCLLALNPEGLTLNQLHASLYGDAKVSMSTLKAELSHLRSRLGGHIGSRPYRLTVPFWADFLQIWKAHEASLTTEFMDLYRGPLLINSDSPELEEWRSCIDALAYKTLDKAVDTVMLVNRMGAGRIAGELVRNRLGGDLSH
ncbi:helix-turn-helix domain-containing protein [Granulosicoccus antarcticus]|uniref:Acetoin dehydrogenase operon transcriptional activator AcoR n=1 Tax=Granulosicoccus antarcticus IMCC3135 TaxID=1192854 RepID=A0A2Z2NSF9_9GAMM|nr:helix-turn-helix domain-containing protein [Granulosicoccus antarcticus]ASJ72678.1 Acetoin dehydrogenase operon transcriptional activator AcoR [Granulosicoccus antarcticus IMCC3135]